MVNGETRPAACSAIPVVIVNEGQRISRCVAATARACARQAACVLCSAALLSRRFHVAVRRVLSLRVAPPSRSVDDAYSPVLKRRDDAATDFRRPFDATLMF